MLPAIVTTLLWSYCLIPARRSVAQLGGNAANFWRLLAAVIVMGLIAWAGGQQPGPSAAGWFFLSGIIGFGFGDIGVFFALPRIGSRLTLLMAQCVAAPLAGLAEWLWLGTTIEPMHILAISIILGGITLALFPERDQKHAAQRNYFSGLLFGLVAAVGQSMGAVCSRKAFAVMEADPLTGVGDYLFLGAATGFTRLLGGILIAGGFWFLSRYRTAWQTPPDQIHGQDSPPQKWKNVLLHAATGPIFGMIFFQWALATTPSALVQPIIAMTPLVVMPMTWFMEHDRPSPRALIGTVVSVAGVLILSAVG